jgi:threonine dehydrogenase-like Zn-dependent dehydrogenase
MKAVYFENSLLRILLASFILRFNKNAALGRFSPIRFTEVAEPRIPNQSWLKVKNKTCGLCGSDIHMIFVEIDPKCFPAAVPSISKKYLGHELLSEVIEAGSDVDGFKTGDRFERPLDEHILSFFVNRS